MLTIASPHYRGTRLGFTPCLRCDGAKLTRRFLDDSHGLTSRPAWIAMGRPKEELSDAIDRSYLYAQSAASLP